MSKPLTWSRNAPTKPGWYWHRCWACEAQILEVFELAPGGHLMIFQEGKNERIDYQDITAHWAGPIPVPEEGEESKC